MALKQIDLKEAVKTSVGSGAVYRLVRIYPDTTIQELQDADGFAVITTEEEKEEKPKGLAKRIDHGRIVALYTADPPRSVQRIANDMKISAQTVINHLKKDGLWKSETEEEKEESGKLSLNYRVRKNCCVSSRPWNLRKARSKLWRLLLQSSSTRSRKS